MDDDDNRLIIADMDTDDELVTVVDHVDFRTRGQLHAEIAAISSAGLGNTSTASANSSGAGAGNAIEIAKLPFVCTCYDYNRKRHRQWNHAFGCPQKQFRLRRTEITGTPLNRFLLKHQDEIEPDEWIIVYFLLKMRPACEMQQLLYFATKRDDFGVEPHEMSHRDVLRKALHHLAVPVHYVDSTNAPNVTAEIAAKQRIKERRKFYKHNTAYLLNFLFALDNARVYDSCEVLILCNMIYDDLMAVAHPNDQNTEPLFHHRFTEQWLRHFLRRYPLYKSQVHFAKKPTLLNYAGTTFDAAQPITHLLHCAEPFQIHQLEVTQAPSSRSGKGEAKFCFSRPKPEDSIFDFDDLLLNDYIYDPIENDWCDCGRRECAGCFEVCRNCRTRKCKRVCRKREFYLPNDSRESKEPYLLYAAPPPSKCAAATTKDSKCLSNKFSSLSLNNFAKKSFK